MKPSESMLSVFHITTIAVMVMVIKNGARKAYTPVITFTWITFYPKQNSVLNLAIFEQNSSIMLDFGGKTECYRATARH